MAEVDIVRRWQQSLVHADEAPASEEPSSVTNVYEACTSLFRDILTALSHDPSTESPVLLSLRRAQSYLVLWADGLDIGEGLLDESLTKSKRARTTTLRLLSSISNTLTNRLLPHVKGDHKSQLASRASELTHMAAQVKILSYQDRKPVFDSDTDSDTSSDGGDTSLGDIAEDLRTDTQCLLDLASRFQEPAIGPVVDEPAVGLFDLNPWNPAQNFTNRIRQRYPQCDISLAERLGNASWSRVLHCQGLKTENSKLKQQAAAALTNESSSKAASTMFHDSGLGSSVPSAPSIPAPSEYAETVVSYDGGQGGSVRVPPLPEGAREGEPFECVGCGTMVTARGKRVWKKHLFQDLRPYICLEDACSRNESPFATKQDWANHLSLEHGDTGSTETVECRICSQNLTGSMVQIATHLARHLEEIALTVLPICSESEEGEDGDSQISSTDGTQREYVTESGVEAEQESQVITREDLNSLLTKHIIAPICQEKDLGSALTELSLGWTVRTLEEVLFTRALAFSTDSEEYSKLGLLIIDTIELSLQFIPKHAHISEGDQPYTEEYFWRKRAALRIQLEESQTHQLDPEPTLLDTSSKDPIEGTPRRKQVSKPKVRTGCTTCRKRRVKCDERKPTCLRCDRLRKGCLWPSEVPIPSASHGNEGPCDPSKNEPAEPVALLPTDSRSEESKRPVAVPFSEFRRARNPSPPVIIKNAKGEAVHFSDYNKAVALFDYNPSGLGGLALSQGQVVIEIERRENGWLLAKDQRTGQEGWVPQQYVRALRNGMGSPIDQLAVPPRVPATSSEYQSRVSFMNDSTSPVLFVDALDEPQSDVGPEDNKPYQDAFGLEGFPESALGQDSLLFPDPKGKQEAGRETTQEQLASQDPPQVYQFPPEETKPQNHFERQQLEEQKSFISGFHNEVEVDDINTSESPADEAGADLKCSKCDFRPSGKNPANHRAYLRKHQQIHIHRAMKPSKIRPAELPADEAGTSSKFRHGYEQASSSVDPNKQPTVTVQDIEKAKTHERFSSLSDEKVGDTLLRMKILARGENRYYECHFKPCPYTSRRKWDCEQHMNKVHGWTRVPTTSNENGGLGVSAGPTPTLTKPSMPNSNRNIGSPQPLAFIDALASETHDTFTEVSPADEEDPFQAAQQSSTIDLSKVARIVCPLCRETFADLETMLLMHLETHHPGFRLGKGDAATELRRLALEPEPSG